MEKINYKNFGECVRMERNGIVAMVTVDIGPRIIYYGTENVNFLNEDIDRNVSKEGDYFDKTYAPGEKWYLYGGHRVWKSPEDMESYTPDNHKVYYSLRERGGTFTTRAGKNFDYTIDAEMDENGRLDIKNIITSKTEETREISVWALTVAAKGGTLVVPLNDPKDELNPYQNLVMWPYNDLSDDRLYFGKRHLALKQTPRENALKVGLFSEKGRAYYVLGDMALQIDYPWKKGVFGDLWCNFETYTNAHILEVEGLSERFTLKKGDSAVLEEKWSLINNARITEINDKALNAFS